MVDQLASGQAAPGKLKVLALLGEGLSNADAGERIHVSEATVTAYVSRIQTKLRCENRVGAHRPAGPGPQPSPSP